MIWLAFADLGDAGNHSRGQFKASLPQAWALGIEQGNKPNFSDLYTGWAANGI